MGSRNAQVDDSAVDAFQAHTDFLADLEDAHERAAKAAFLMLQAEFMAALNGVTNSVTMGKSTNGVITAPMQSVADAEQDVYFAPEVMDKLIAVLDKSACPFAIEYKRLLNSTASEQDMTWVELVNAQDKAQFLMYRKSECPLVIALKKEMSEEYARMHSDEVAQAAVMQARFVQ